MYHFSLKCFVSIVIIFVGFLSLNAGSGLPDKGIQFSDIFLQKDSPITLMQEQSLIGSLRALKVDSQNNFWCLDSKARNIKQYDNNGKFIRTIGKKGPGPGEFVRPLAFWIDDDNLLVGDPQSRKLHVFDKSRKFERFFRIRDCREMHRLDVDTIILGAAVKDHDKTGACLHLFDMRKGDIKKSFYPISENALKNRMIGDGIFFDLDKENNIYSIQEMEYQISKFNSTGNLLKTFSSPNSQYKAPPSKPFEDFLQRSKLTAWIKSWTHIHGLFVVGNRIIIQMIQFQEEDTYYLLDLYSLDGTPLYQGIRSKYRLLNSDSNEILYFINENPEAEEQINISKFMISEKTNRDRCDNYPLLSNSIGCLQFFQCLLDYAIEN